MSGDGPPIFRTCSLRLAACVMTAGISPTSRTYRPDGKMEFSFEGVSEDDVTAAWTSQGFDGIRKYMASWDSLYELVKHGRSRNGREIKG